MRCTELFLQDLVMEEVCESKKAGGQGMAAGCCQVLRLPVAPNFHTPGASSQQRLVTPGAREKTEAPSETGITCKEVLGLTVTTLPDALAHSETPDACHKWFGLVWVGQR